MRLIKTGKAMKEAVNEMQTPIDIIQPKSITGRTLLIVKDAKAATVVRVVNIQGLSICCNVFITSSFSAKSG
jgi:hypothetical protein